MRWRNEIFGVKVRKEVKILIHDLLSYQDEIDEIHLSGEGMKTKDGNLISNTGFRLKQSEIQYIKKSMLKSKDTQWKCETKIIEGDTQNFGKVEVLTKFKAQ